MSSECVIDSLSELFVIEEFYEQLETDRNIDIAGNHLRLAKMLREKTYVENDIKMNDSVTLYKVEGKTLHVNANELLPYEKVLLSRLCSAII